MKAIRYGVSSRKGLLAASFFAAMLASVTALAFSPWGGTVSVTSYYDSYGQLVGTEGFGDCGFSLMGDRTAASSSQTYTCSDFNNIPMPF